jgi:hypothetical protein
MGVKVLFKTIVRRVLPLSLLLTAAMPLLAATLEQLSVDDMIAQSTAIVRGKVTGSYAAARGSIIYTHYTVQVSEQWKGTNSGTVDVVVPGGTANNIRQTFVGAPQFAAGDECVFFLWTGPSGLTQIMGLTQGIFRLSPNSPTGRTATRKASTELMLDRSTSRSVKDQTLVMSLSDLRARVTGASPKDATQ